MPKITARSVQTVGIFVLVAFVAIGIIIATAYFASQRGEQARRDEAREIAKQMEQEQDQGTQSGTDTPPTDDGTSPSEADSENQPDETVEELPATGVEDAIMQTVAVGALSLSIAMYISSRRPNLS